RNRCTADWLPADDLFRWRERIPVARWGLAELQVMGWPILVAVVVLALATWYAAVVPAAILLWLVWFFRDPPRRVPEEPGLVVSPADGRIAEITELAHDPFIDGPAVRIGIFLSIFNVHINRSPVAARVIELRYRRGEFLNALRAESAERNENTWIALEEAQPPYRRYVVRQIAGAIARRIVCALRPDEVVQRGAKFGMIKFGSRTELILPAGPGLTIACRKGQAVHAGTSVLARWEEPGGGNSDQAVEG
ncbi:MAG: phosphatidylserine decarboxylase family protein, partial [Planctomycetota bacterium]